MEEGGETGKEIGRPIVYTEIAEGSRILEISPPWLLCLVSIIIEICLNQDILIIKAGALGFCQKWSQTSCISKRAFKEQSWIVYTMC